VGRTGSSFDGQLQRVVAATDTEIWARQDTPRGALIGYSGRIRKLKLEMMATGLLYDETSVQIQILNGLPNEYKVKKEMLINQGTELRWDAVMPMLYHVYNENMKAAAAQ